MDGPAVTEASCPRCGGSHPPGGDCAGSGLTGRTLAGGIQVRERLGETTRGQVYRAQEIRTGAELELLTFRAAASWTMSPGNNADSERLWNQLSRARSINHPNVPIVRGIGTTPEGTRYVALEVLYGELLSEILSARGVLPPMEAQELVLQAAAGLEAAHREGVLHGNLSPDTILVTRDSDDRPVVKLIRFGWAAETGFTAPEQLAGQRGDERSDVYGLAAVLYSMLTGELPTSARRAHGVPADLWGVVSKALDPLPSRRFATVGAFRRALLTEKEAPPEEENRSDGGGRRIAAVGAGLSALVAGLWLLFGSELPRLRQAGASPAEVSLAQPRPQPRESAVAPTSAPREPIRQSGRTAPAVPRGTPAAPLAAPDPEAPRHRAAGPPAEPVPDSPAPAPADSAVGYAPDPSGERSPASPSALTETTAMRLALGDVTRLEIVADYEEVRPGRLMLTVGDGYYTSTSVEYNLRQLYAAYSELLGHPKQSPVLELWSNGRKLGEYTREGLSEGLE